MTNYHDLVELVRSLVIKNVNIFQEYLTKNVNELTITNECLLELKLKLIILYALDSRAKKKLYGQEKSNLDADCDELKNYIVAINCIKTLSKLNATKTALTEFQMKVCQSMRSFLRNFVKKEYCGQFGSLKHTLHPDIEIILTETEHLDKEMHILCVYCDKMSCEHELPRCIFSTLQLPLMNQRYCTCCRVAALDDDNLLNEIIEIDDKDGILCLFCDSRMSKNNSI